MRRSRNDADLMVLGDAKDDVVLQNVQGVVHGVDSKVCWPLQSEPMDTLLAKFKDSL